MSGADPKPSIVRVLPPVAPSSEIVSILESLLARAKRGEIKAIAVATHMHPVSTGSVFSLGSDGDIAHLVTGLERCKKRLLEIEGSSTRVGEMHAPHAQSDAGRVFARRCFARKERDVFGDPPAFTRGQRPRNVVGGSNGQRLIFGARHRDRRGKEP